MLLKKLVRIYAFYILVILKHVKTWVIGTGKTFTTRIQIAAWGNHFSSENMISTIIAP